MKIISYRKTVSQSINKTRIRSSRPEVFRTKGDPRNFTKFTGKHLYTFIVKLCRLSGHWIGDRFDGMLRNGFVCGVNQESTHLLLLTPVWIIVKWNKWSIVTVVGKALQIALSLESAINQSLDRTYSSCFMRAIIARMRPPFFKIFSNFVHFCQNFILPFFVLFLKNRTHALSF